MSVTLAADQNYRAPCVPALLCPANTHPWMTRCACSTARAPSVGGEITTPSASASTRARYLVYCRSGARSAEAAAIMQNNGFTDVTD